MNLDMTRCRECGELIVINLGDLDYPTCQRVQCFASAFPDDFKELEEEMKIAERTGENKT